MSEDRSLRLKYEAALAARNKFICQIVTSTAPKKLVVAGPGTGKTHLFLQVLQGTSDNLTLTFVTSLVEDLSLKLAVARSARAVRPVEFDLYAISPLVSLRPVGAFVPAVALPRLGPDPQSGLLACQGARRRGQSRWGPVAPSHGSDQRRPQHQGGRDGRRPRAAGAVSGRARATARLARLRAVAAESARLLAARRSRIRRR